MTDHEFVMPFPGAETIRCRNCGAGEGSPVGKEPCKPVASFIAAKNRDELKARTIRDLNWLERCVKDYRNGLEGRPCSHTLQDIELVVKEIRQRFDAAKAVGKQERTE